MPSKEYKLSYSLRYILVCSISFFPLFIHTYNLSSFLYLKFFSVDFFVLFYLCLFFCTFYLIFLRVPGHKMWLIQRVRVHDRTNRRYMKRDMTTSKKEALGQFASVTSPMNIGGQFREANEPISKRITTSPQNSPIQYTYFSTLSTFARG